MKYLKQLKRFRHWTVGEYSNYLSGANYGYHNVYSGNVLRIVEGDSFVVIVAQCDDGQRRLFQRFEGK